MFLMYVLRVASRLPLKSFKTLPSTVPSKWVTIQTVRLYVSRRCRGTSSNGRDHTQVAITLFNLGVAHGCLGDNSKKHELLKRVLPIWTRAYGNDHPHTKLCQKELAKLASS